mmetsp:Transcript_11073/g.15525  ORF Transcript_11073/g.15525 Transcript_11073/m.15525 type:complete len:225 (-) Transcript_11073:51-725(-)
MKFAAKVFALIAFLLCCSFVCDAFVVPSAPSSVAQRRVSALSNSLKYFPKDASRAGLVNTRMMVKADPRVSTQPPTESVVAFEETTRRSFVKALAWRITAGIITFITSFLFSGGNMKTAATIVGSDFVSKAGFMFLGERLWSKVKWGTNEKADSKSRSASKAILWRIFAASNTLFAAAFISKDLSIAAKVASSDTVFKTGLFYLNERMWQRIEWGKTYIVEYNL